MIWLVRHLVRGLVLLFPRPFRDRFGAEIAAVWEEGQVEASNLGRRAATRFALVTLIGLAHSAVSERLRPTLSPALPPTGPWIENHRDGARLMDRLSQDFRHAARSLRHQPGFTVVVVLVLGVAVGAATAIFGVVHGVLLRPLPFPEPDRLVALSRSVGGDARRAMSQPDLRDLAGEGAFSHVLGYFPTTLTLTQDRPELVEAARVSTGPLAVFGLTPAAGRDLRAEENVVDGPRVVLLSDSFWRSQFGADPGVVGSTLELDGEAYEVVGVAPPGFSYPEVAELWLPIHLDEEGCGRGCHNQAGVARLAPTVSLEEATARAEVLSRALEAAHPSDNYDKRFLVTPLDQELFGDVERPLVVLMAAVAVVLLIACANVANLLLVRASRRQGEMAIRAALGGRPRRLASQLLAESVLLAVAAGALGLGVAHAGLHVLLALAPSDLPRLGEVRVDWVVLLFCLALTVVVSLLFGLIPTLRLSRVAPASVLGQAGRGNVVGKDAAQRLLLVGELALSVVLLLAAGLLLRSFQRMNQVDLGFASDRLTLFTVALPEASYPQPEQNVRFFEQLEAELVALPGVEAVGSVFGSPMGRARISASFTLLDRDPPVEGQEPTALLRVVTPGFREALSMPLLRGRFLEPTDRRDQPPVAVVSQSFAERFFPGGDAVGATFDVGVGFGWEEEKPRTIVGVVGDIRSQGVTVAAEPEIYLPDAQMAAGYMTVMARSLPGAPDLLPPIREVLARLDPSLALRDVETMDAVLASDLAPARFQVVLLGAFASLAVFLAAVGLYGVVAYAVAGRTREIALRVALGADRARVVGLVLGQGAAPVALGVGIGLAIAVLGSRLLSSLLYDIGPRDPATFVAVVVLLASVALGATLIPAARAVRISPMAALKDE